MKKIILTALLFISPTLFAKEIDQETKAAALKQVSAGPLSAKNEKLVRQALEKYGTDTSNMKLIQPSNFAIEVNPLNEFVSYNLPYNFFYVNERAFNKLSTPEKEAIIAGWAIWINNYSKDVRNGWILIILLFVVEALLAFALYKYLGRASNLSRGWRIAIAVGFYLAMDFADEIWKRKYYQPSLRLKQDRQIIQAMGSKEAFLSMLKKRRAALPELQKTANAQFWLAVEPELDRRIAYLETV